jgi:hypothetical protein
MKRLIAMLALTVPALAMAQATGNASSSAQTASNSGSVASPQQSLSLQSYAPDHQSERVYSNPTVYAPGMSSGFSPMNCANSVSGGASGALIGFSLGAPKESVWCNGRADATILMQMSNAVRVIDPALAGQLVTAAAVTMCQQSDATVRAMKAAGMCRELGDTQASTTSNQYARADLSGLYPAGGR